MHTLENTNLLKFYEFLHHVYICTKYTVHTHVLYMYTGSDLKNRKETNKICKMEILDMIRVGENMDTYIDVP